MTRPSVAQAASLFRIVRYGLSDSYSSSDPYLLTCFAFRGASFPSLAVGVLPSFGLVLAWALPHSRVLSKRQTRVESRRTRNVDS